MSQDDRPDDAPTEWLSPALYRQLCDAVDAALYAPPDARDALLAARLGSDQRLLGEARALLASHEASPRTMLTPLPAPGGNPGGNDETFIGRPDSNATIIRRDSATVIVPGSGSRRAYDPTATAGDGTQEMAALSAAPPASGTATIPSPIAAWQPDSTPPPMAAPVPPPPQDPLAATTPGVPRAVRREPDPPSAPEPAPIPPPLASRPASRPAIPIAEPSPPAPEPLPPVAAPAQVRGVDLGVPTPVRTSGTPIGGYLGWIVALLAIAGLGATVWMLMGARSEQQDATARLALAEKRFGEVRQLGKRLAEVDRLLAVTSDPGAQAARGVLLRTWLQYLTDLQRASGSTEKELLFEVAKGYRQLAASQGGINGRGLGDRAAAAKTLQIGENLLNYLDRNSGDPNREILQELIATQIDLGDVYSVGKDTVASTEKYRRALAAAERLGAAGVGAADVKRHTDLIRQRIQSGPPAAPPATVDAGPVGAAQQP